MSEPSQVDVNRQATLVGIGLAALSFGLFASHDVLVKILGTQYSTFQIIFFSALFSFAPMTLVMSADRAVENFQPHNLKLIGLRSILSVVGMGSAFYALTVLPLTEVYAIIFAMPLLITVLAVPILGEKIRLQRGLAVIVGLVGVLIVLRPGVAEFTSGHLAALVTAFMGAFSSLIVRKLGKSERTAVLVLYPMLANLLIMAALLPSVYIPTDLLSLASMAVVGGLALIGQFLLVSAYRRAPAAVVAPIQYTQIVWATIYGWLVFQDLPDRWVVIGAAIIISSGLFIVWRETQSNISDNKPVLRARNMRPDTGPNPKPKDQIIIKDDREPHA
ncbi:MAG: DMT family transporter [Pseudomonadota bacterium]